MDHFRVKANPFSDRGSARCMKLWLQNPDDWFLRVNVQSVF